MKTSGFFIHLITALFLSFTVLKSSNSLISGPIMQIGANKVIYSFGGFHFSIGITDFKGICQNDSVILKWHTASEIDAKYYMIEQSNDGMNWMIIGSVGAFENSAAGHDYSYTDTIIHQKTSYYRLCQVDNQSNVKYSNLIDVESCTSLRSPDVIICPNPTNGVFSLLVSSNGNDQKFIEIFNLRGERVYYSDEDLWLIDLSKNPDGLYFLNYNVNGKSTIKKIELKR